MCNKCDVTSTPVTPVTPVTPLLVKWADTKYDINVAYRHYSMRTFMQANLTPPTVGRGYLSRGTKLRYKEVGRELALLKAKADKTKNREALTVEDMADTHAYLEKLSVFIPYIGRHVRSDMRDSKIEPMFSTAIGNSVSGVWERIDVSKLGAESQSQRVMNALHLLHVSTEDPTQVAYYPTLKHLREGREVRTKLGRYLGKYRDAFQLSELQVKTIAEDYIMGVKARAGWAVKFVAHDDPQGWVEVYSSDVGSCMRGEDTVRVYAHEKSVLRLAYLVEEGEPVARCIVRDDIEKGWVRVYPDPHGSSEGRYLLDYLNANGYEARTNLNGVLLQCIEADDDRYVCPYIDMGNGGVQSVAVDYKDRQRYLVAGGGDMKADEVDGLTSTGTRCDCCGGMSSVSDIHYVESDDRRVCDDCLGDDYIYAIGGSYHEYYRNEDCIEVNGEWYLRETVSEHCIYMCEHSNEYYHMDDLISTLDGMYHEDYVVNLDIPDSEGNQYAYEDNVAVLSDGKTCHSDDEEKYQAEIDEAIEETEA